MINTPELKKLVEKSNFISNSVILDRENNKTTN